MNGQMDNPKAQWYPPTIVLTTKRGNCECIATWGRQTPRQSFSALIMTLCQVWSRWTYPLLYHSVFAADTLLYAVTLTQPWPWHLTFDVEHLQSTVTWWNSVPNLNRAIRGGVSAISVFDLMTLNMCYVLRSAIG